MEQKQVFLTEYDHDRLLELIESAKEYYARDQDYLEQLEEDLSRCRLVDSRSIPADVVTMNSRVRIRDLDTDKEMEVTLVFPQKANLEAGRLSILSPIGAAILGGVQGQVVQRKVRSGIKQIRIEAILYQPEAAGNFDL
ncbi:nucleoside diphosphate kinase regulator [Desulfuromonas sp. CSMB_57]|jgi:regulator of nucleoside diphosphate kinase|uniref:nucleoside diphosphate kinase regulator n=1 Tax=Desulfuromonas sp. CSMB_57 TaxID=2807629 RepID=UPI001CD62003|nr:nucleoside diphosphate kinase regulator [Desulfuromonas sp. CSMB_57]